MEPKAQGVSPESAGFLKGCLVEADPVQERGARRLKRRAVFFSVLFQLVCIAALVVYPLLSKGEVITATIPPSVPYIFTGHPDQPRTPVHPRPIHRMTGFFQPRSIPHVIDVTPQQVIENTGPSIPGAPTGPREGTGVIGAPDFGTSAPPARPEPVETQKRRVRIGTIEPAMLTHRIDPTYPPIARQLGRGGRVELHAIIATDGSIQSLEVVSGDPLFYQSALAAVQQWRYRPTILNGQAVEVDTQIVVVYTLAH
jgi:periplasmic protein TonB